MIQQQENNTQLLKDPFTIEMPGVLLAGDPRSDYTRIRVEGYPFVEKARELATVLNSHIQASTMHDLLTEASEALRTRYHGAGLEPGERALWTRIEAVLDAVKL